MGSYASLRIGGFEVLGTKNGIDPRTMSLFRPADRHLEKIPASEDALRSYDREDLVGEVPEVTILQYRSTAGCLADRLDLMGFTLENATKAFARGVADEIQSHVMTLADNPGEPLGPIYREVLAEWKRFDFEAWSRGFQRLSREGLTPLLPDLAKGARHLDFPLSLMLEDSEQGERLGFPAEDPRYLLRAAVASVTPETPVVMDLSDLVLGGWCDGDDLIEDAALLVSADFQTTRRIILLTEGSTDRDVLGTALKVLFPHLSDYFAFLDFQPLRVPGGAEFALRILKAFGAAGIVNRVVAILDNDTGAAVALKVMAQVTLPRNMTVFQLPPLEALRSYPCLGPTGIVSTDVNGLAASIELYLGDDVLRRPDGDLTPVQWQGFDRSLGRYQGELVDKREVLQRFKAKVAKARETPEFVGSQDWAPLRTVLEHLIKVASALQPLNAVV